MPAHRLDMRLVREVLRLKLGAGLTHRAIASALGLGVGTVTNYLAAFDRSGLGFPLPDDFDDTELVRRLFPEPSVRDAAARPVLPDFAAIQAELRQKGVTRQLLWEEYCADAGDAAYRYTQFCVLYRRWLGRQRLSMRQTHRPGEKMFVDYCGRTVPIVDAATGEFREAQIFVAVLGASNYTFVEATYSQKLEDWTGSHIRAFRFFGGVPQLVVPDNLKSAVTQACRYEPILNRTYEEMLRHYNTAALPARPRKPKDKSKAEVGVQVVTRWILARLRKQTFFSLLELQIEIRRLGDILNDRKFKGLTDSRRSRFEELDRSALQPLPATDYEFSEWLRKRVGIDYHIEIERHFYSVPATFARREVEVRLTASAVECFADGKRIAVHARSRLVGHHSTTAEHMPKAHRAHLEWTPGRFLNWAAEIGESTRELVDYLLCNRPHPEMGFRSCLGLLGLKKRFGGERLETSCRRALDNGTPSRRSVVSILRQGLDRLPPTAETEPPPLLLPHENIRGPDYYC